MVRPSVTLPPGFQWEDEPPSMTTGTPALPPGFEWEDSTPESSLTPHEVRKAISGRYPDAQPEEVDAWLSIGNRKGFAPTLHENLQRFGQWRTSGPQEPSTLEKIPEVAAAIPQLPQRTADWFLHEGGSATLQNLGTGAQRFNVGASKLLGMEAIPGVGQANDARLAQADEWSRKASEALPQEGLDRFAAQNLQGAVEMGPQVAMDVALGALAPQALFAKFGPEVASALMRVPQFGRGMAIRQALQAYGEDPNQLIAAGKALEAGAEGLATGAAFGKIGHMPARASIPSMGALGAAQTEMAGLREGRQPEAGELAGSALGMMMLDAGMRGSPSLRREVMGPLEKPIVSRPEVGPETIEIPPGNAMRRGVDPYDFSRPVVTPEVLRTIAEKDLERLIKAGRTQDAENLKTYLDRKSPLPLAEHYGHQVGTAEQMKAWENLKATNDRQEWLNGVMLPPGPSPQAPGGMEAGDVVGDFIRGEETRVQDRQNWLDRTMLPMETPVQPSPLEAGDVIGDWMRGQEAAERNRKLFGQDTPPAVGPLIGVNDPNFPAGHQPPAASRYESAQGTPFTNLNQVPTGGNPRPSPTQQEAALAQLQDAIRQGDIRKAQQIQAMFDRAQLASMTEPQGPIPGGMEPPGDLMALAGGDPRKPPSSPPPAAPPPPPQGPPPQGPGGFTPPVPPTAPQEGMPPWAREEMLRRGLSPNRPLNDVDVGNASVRAAIESDPSLTPEQKARVLKTGSPEMPPSTPGNITQGPTGPVPGEGVPRGTEQNIERRDEVRIHPEELRGKTPEEQAAIIQRWAQSHDTHKQEAISSRTDALTGLMSRQRYENTLEDSHTHHLMMDLRGFKNINDNMGHAAGDEALRQVGDAILRAVRDAGGETEAGRWGGDEFFVRAKGEDTTLLPRIKEDIDRRVAGIRIEMDDGRTFGLDKGIRGAYIQGAGRKGYAAAIDALHYVSKGEGGSAREPGGDRGPHPTGQGQEGLQRPGRLSIPDWGDRGGPPSPRRTEPAPEPTPPNLPGRDKDADVRGRVGRSQKDAGGRNPVKGPRGSETRVKYESGDQPARFALVEAADLNVDHPDYQNRNASPPTRWIGEKGEKFDPAELLSDNPRPQVGAPVVNGADGGVIAGNTRTKMVRFLAENNPEKLRQWKVALAKQASRFGLRPSQVVKMKAPILVRVLEGTQEGVGKMVEEGNRQITTSLSAAEKAASDATKLPDAVLDSLQQGEEECLSSALNRPSNISVRQRVFGLLFPKSEWTAQIDPKNKGLSQEALARIENAITAKALGLPKDSPALNALLVSTEAGVNNIKAAFQKAGGALLKGRSYLSAREITGNPIESLGKAVEKYVSLKEAGKDVGEFLSGSQGSLFGEEARTEGMGPDDLTALEHINDLAKSPKRLREFLSGVAQAVQEAPKKGQRNLLGELASVTTQEVLDAARKGTEGGSGPTLYSSVIPGLTSGRVETLVNRGVDLFLSGARTLTEWSKAMRAYYGAKIRPHLQKLWAAAQKTLKDERGFARFLGGPFEQQISQLRKGRLDPRLFLDYGKTPDVLRMLGIEDLPLGLMGSKVIEIAKEHPEITDAVLSTVRDAIHRPVMVFDSKEYGTDGAVILTEVWAEGKPVVVALHLGKQAGRMTIHKVASVYGKDGVSKVAGWLDGGLLRYADKEKSQRWLSVAGLRRPGVQARPWLTPNIKTEEDLVKWRASQRKGEAGFIDAPGARGPSADGKDTTFHPGPTLSDEEMNRRILAAEARRGVSQRNEPLEQPAAKVEATVRKGGDVVGMSLEKEVFPAVRKGALGVARTGDDILKLMAPHARGEGALTTANLVREANARLAHRYQRASESLKVFQKAFNSMPTEEALGFIDRMERGKPHGDARLDSAARTIRVLMDSTWKRVQEVKGTEAFIKNYFPHIWKDPEAASSVWARIFGKSSMEGSKSFLKKRSIPTTAEGIEMGLEPVSYNPVDLALLKYHEMNRYLMGHEIMTGLQELNLTKYVRSGEAPEPGFTRIDDKIATIFGPPIIEKKEYFDQAVYSGLEDLARSIGVRHDRRASIGGTRLGYSVTGGDQVVTKFATPEDVLAHEVGHQIDDKYGLWKRIMVEPYGRTKEIARRRRVAISKELRTLMEETGGPKTWKAKRVEKAATLIQTYIHSKAILEEKAPTVLYEFEKFLDEHPEVGKKIRAIKPSLMHGERVQEIPVGGLRIMGNYYAPSEVAHVLNNFLSPGLRGKPLYDALMGVGNTLNQANLGLSGFHLIFTTGDAMVSKTALGIEQLFQGGRRAEGFANIFKGISPHTPVENLIRGSQLYRAYLKGNITDPRMVEMVDALVAGGGRVKMESFYKNNSIEKFLSAVRERRPLAAGVHSVPATLELVAKPLMEWIVPRQKLGVFADLAANELARLDPGTKREVVRAAMAKAWDSVDNRMGQLVYDNLFWHKSLKDLGMVSVRSLGWNLGTVRELGGAVVDVGKQGVKALRGEKPEVTHRMAYAVALPFVTGLYGALIQYLYTGKGPDDLKDYYFPKTGRKNADGSAERLALPSYMKDVATATLGFRTGPSAGLKGMATMAGHKVHPMVSAIIDMMRNQDFYGTEIRHEGDPLVQQAKDEVLYMLKQYVPFSVTAYMKRREAGEGVGQSLQAFAGLQPASGLMTKTLAQHLMQGYLADMMPKGARTKEAFEASQRRKELRGELRGGEAEGRRHLLDALRSGEITPRQARDLLKSSKQDPRVSQFTRLPFDQAAEVWSYGTSEEKKLWARVLIVKGRNAMKTATPSRKRAIFTRLMEVRKDFQEIGAVNAPGEAP